MTDKIDFSEFDLYFDSVEVAEETPPLSEQFYMSFGYYPEGVYCLVTGKRLGQLNIFEFHEVLAALPKDNSLADLRFKLLASMRPGMKWNKMRVESLDDMRKRHPVETMAWLLNRLFDPAKSIQRPLAWDVLHENRIKLFALLDSFHQHMQHIPGNAWDQVFLRLLELHAKFDLKNEIAPFTCADILAIPFESLMVDFLKLLTPWYERRVRAYDEALDRAELMRTNPMARRAFLNTFMEQKPETEATIKKAEKQRESNVLSSLLDEIMGDNSNKPMAQRPAAELLTPVKSESLPSSKMPLRFGVKR